VRAVFEFPADRLNLGAFNLTSFRPGRDKDLDRLGLFLAARSVDRLQIVRLGEDRVRLVIEKEKPYAAYEGEEPPPAAGRTGYDVREAEPAELGVLSRLIVANRRASEYPEWFKYPQKMIDMASAGEVAAFVGLDPGGSIGGGLIWRWLSDRTVECFGPYTFGAHQGTDLNESLTEALVGGLGRSKCVSLVDQYPADDFPTHFFQRLGFLDSDAGRGRRPVYIRMLKEDPGASVWALPPLTGFLREVYDRLALPREILDPGGSTAPPGDESVLFGHVNRLENTAVLAMAAMGGDLGDNLDRHLRLFEKQNVDAVYFQLDVGDSVQAGAIGPLERTGFQPRLVIPYGGRGDVVVYESRSKAS
jgi:hypothetical protein